MSRSPRSTYRLALLAVGLSALVVTAGCAGSLGELGANDGGGDAAKLDSVPASAEYVGYVDAAGMASDESLRSIANTALEARGEYDDDAPADVDAMFEQAESDSGLDPQKVESMTVFGTTADDPMAGQGTSAVILSSSYSEDELVSAMEESDAGFSEGSYGDTTVYSYEGEMDSGRTLAVLGDGEFALGDRSAVESVVDVRAGDADTLGGDLKSTFQNTDDDGYVRMAMATPTEDIADEEVAEDAPIDTSTLNTVEYVSMSFGTGDGNVTTTVNMISASESDAKQTYDLVDGALSLYSGMGSDEMQDALDAVSVEQNGDTVTVTHSDTVENVESLVETMYGAGVGSASESGSATGSDSNSAAVAPVTAPATLA
jgi:hypothetical protein